MISIRPGAPPEDPAVNAKCKDLNDAVCFTNIPSGAQVLVPPHEALERRGPIIDWHNFSLVVLSQTQIMLRYRSGYASLSKFFKISCCSAR